ncbi:MAG: response regulator [Spirochaetales bacterium]|nr:response regulator [Spirochaetales bacterium]
MDKKRIFIVEDENIVSLDMKKRLEKLGYDVPGIAASGEDAVKMVLEQKPDLVLMDIKLSGKMDGVEAAGEILKSYSVPIVYITAYAENTTLKRAKITEPFGYILKPFEERELHINIEIALYKHKMQDIVKEREQLLFTTLQSIDDAVIVTDNDNNIQFFNPKAEMFTGVKKKEALGKKLQHLVQIEDSEIQKKPKVGNKDAAAKNQSLKLLVTKDGEKRFIKTSVAPILGSNKSAIGKVYVYHDITAHELAKQALRKSEERYRQFFEDDLTGDFIAGADGTILICNQAFATMLGFNTPTEVVKTNLATYYPALMEKNGLVELLQKEKKLKQYNTKFIDKNRQPLYITANIVGEYSATGKLRHFKGYLIDNTEQKKIEAQLIQSNKMEGIGRLAGGIAHDFNNLLGAIIGYSDLILETVEDDNPIRSEVTSIIKAGKKAAVLTKQLLAFSRRQVLQPKIVNLNTLIVDLERMLKRLLPENIRLFAILDENLWPVKIDPVQIEQVLINLALNARDAMREGGKLSIESSNITISEHTKHGFIGLKNGQYVMLRVTDTGHGMDAELKEKIFEPFFTTKAPGKGTGLGLSTAYGIIKQSNGFIFVDSALSVGSTFTIYLPRVKEEVVQEEEITEWRPSVKGTESILLVEDEDIFREMVYKVLGKFGYNVLEASNAGEALLICEQYNAPIHLLITDIVMPHLSGIKLSERLLEIRPDIKILYISGYFDNEYVEKDGFQKGTYFLQKPFSIATLEKKIREILDLS